MADFVDSTVKDIDSRLSELETEVGKLRAARAALVGRGGRRPGRPAGSTNRATRATRATRTTSTTRGTRGTRGRRRAAATTAAAATPRRRRGGNTRATQALELVKSRPGITIPQIATALKIEPNYLYRVMPKLVQDGTVKRDGQGWRPAS